MSETFLTSGTLTLDSTFDGRKMTIVAVAGGGGGGACAMGITFGRTGAGGGSGAMAVYEVVLRGDTVLEWTIGSGGAEGLAGCDGARPIRPGFQPMSGEIGGSTIVKLNGAEEIVAAGGFGGSVLPSSGTIGGTGYTSTTPYIGGPGGIPGGRCGRDGVPNVKFTQAGTAKGGAGGASPIERGGEGGAGGDVQVRGRNRFGAFVTGGGQRPGVEGQSGAVMVFVGNVALPTLTSQQIDNECGTSLIAFRALADAVLRLCESQESGCTVADKAEIRGILANIEVSASQGALALLGSEALKKVLRIWFSPTATIVRWILAMPGDVRRDDPPLWIVPNPEFNQYTEGNLQERYGAIVVAIAYVNSLRISPDNLRVVELLKQEVAKVVKEMNTRYVVKYASQRGPGFESRPPRDAEEARADKEFRERLEQTKREADRPVRCAVVCACDEPGSIRQHCWCWPGC